MSLVQSSRRYLVRITIHAGRFAPAADAAAVWNMLTSSWLNLLLICLPIGIWAGWAKHNALLVFVMVR
jgi:hypothetical protein